MILIAVLIKDLAIAKQRLAPVLSPAERRDLAAGNARQALRAAAACGDVVAICGSAEAAELARDEGAEVIVEAAPSGQNAAGELAIATAGERGAEALLLLSSDLPLVDGDALRRFLDRAPALTPPLMVAAAATGRQGTNALLLQPPGPVSLHFGELSLPKFAAEAMRRGRVFVVHDDPALALDIDEAGDLDTLARLRASA